MVPMAEAPRTSPSLWQVVTDSDRDALRGLLDAACALSGAEAAWWEDDQGHRWPPEASAATAPRSVWRDPPAAAASDTRALSLVLVGASSTATPAALHGLVRTATALLAARAESAAARREAERLLDAGRAASDWLWETDVEGRVIWMTDSILSATGRSAAAEVGTRTIDVNRVRTDEYAASYARYLADRAARRPIRGLVLDRDTPAGTITVSINGNPRFDGEGNFLGYRGATRNITAELQAREQARRSHELLQQALEGMPASVMISGPDDHILMANRRWYDSVGHGLPPDCDTWDAVVRHHARCGHYPDATGREQEYVAWRLAQSSTQATPLEIRWKEHWALSADQRLSDGSTVHLSIDISDRKRAERKADQALRDKHAAEALSRRTSEFLARMSHEVRTPLNAVIGFAELLHLRGEYQAEQVEHILAAARHLLVLINDVLDLQQVEQGTLALREGAVHTDAMVREVAALLRPQADKRGVSLHPAMLAGAWVRADAQRLRQVLLNLGSNAIKYNRDGGEVRWSVDDSDPARWGVVTADTGAGLDAEQLDRLFQPFERLGHEGSDVEGSGLGLLIARRLVEAMGGTLAMASTPGAGTRVTVWLPRAMPATAEVSPPLPAASPGVAQAPAGARRRVLYVEDNALNVLLFEEVLRRQPDVELRVATSGEEALTLVDHWTPELFIIDMNLPGVTGTELLRALRLRPALAGVPAVVCSADAMPEDRARALAAGFDHYWTKPIDVHALPGAITAALHGGKTDSTNARATTPTAI